MTLILLLAGSLVLTFCCALGVAFTTTKARIAGAYDRERLLPGEIDTRLRSLRKLQAAFWAGIIIALIAAGIVAHVFYQNEIQTEGGWWYEVLYTPLIDLHIPFWIGHPAIYLLFAVLLIVTSYISVRMGVKAAAHGFLLTRTLPAVAKPVRPAV